MERRKEQDLTWQPLSVRDGRADENGPYEGVPDHLFEPLRHWVDTSFTGDPGFMDGYWGGPRLAAAVRYPIRPRPDQPLTVQEITLSLQRAVGRSATLDIVDAVLHLYASISKPVFELPVGALQASLSWDFKCSELDDLLELAGSVWRVGPNCDRLVRRVDPTATGAFVQASSPGDVAGAELKEAWTAA
jgi:hypothetical protein